jgi:hypothetical protein
MRERRNKEKDILKNYVLLAKEKMGIDHLTEGVRSSCCNEKSDRSSDIYRENNQVEIQHMKK